MYDFGVTSNGITPTPNYIKMRPTVLDLKYGDRQTDVQTRSALYVRFQVLTAASTKMVVFWVVAPCSLVTQTAIFSSICLHVVHIVQRTHN
jgi:hypothetical protein